MRILRNILITLLMAVVCGCGTRHDSRLERADALACADPAAALCVLDSIDADGLTDADRAWYGLLRAKAADKSYRHIDNDSLIGFAADFFAGRGDSLEIQALYYQGYGLSRNNQLEEALVVLSEAYEKADEANEDFYAGMSAREMAAVCVRLMMTREQLKYARLAKHRFEMAGKPEHSMWMDETILSSLILNREYDEAYRLLYTIESESNNDNEEFQMEIQTNKAELAFDLGKFDEVVSCYEKNAQNGYQFTAHDLYLLSDASFRIGNFDRAQNYFELGDGLAHAREDSLYRLILKAKFAVSNGDYKNAYETTQILASSVMESDEPMLVSPGNSQLLNKLRIKNEVSKTTINYQRNLTRALSIGCVILLLLVTITVLYIRLLAKTRQMEADRLLAEAEWLRNELSLNEKTARTKALITEDLRNHVEKLEGDIESRVNEYNDLASKYEHIAKQYEEANETLDKTKATIELSDNLKRDVRELFGRHIALLNNLCSAYYTQSNPGENESDLSKKLRKVLHQIREINISDKLRTIIDHHDDNWITRFMEANPNLKQKQYTMVMYLYLGLSPEAITVLMGKATLTATYMEKTKLKKQIMKEGHGDEFLGKLNMKGS